MSTRAIEYLRRNEVAFETVRYAHAQKGAAYAAQATGFALENTTKTLVVALSTGQFCFVLMPGHLELDLKRLAMAVGVKRAAMADAADAQRLTGYLVGGISPFGAKQPLAAIIEASLLNADTLLINAGQRGIMLKMRPADIIASLDCTLAQVARHPPDIV